MIGDKLAATIAWVERCHAPFSEEEKNSKYGIFHKRCNGCPKNGQFGCRNKLVLELVDLIKNGR